MYKAMIVGAVMALGLTGWRDESYDVASVALKEEAMVITYNEAMDEAAIAVEAESEQPLDRVDVRDPHGASTVALRAAGGEGLALSGFQVETRESTAAELFATYPEGVYDMRARVVDGRSARGAAVLSHQLLRAPVMVYPLEGARNVPTEHLRVRWIANPHAVGYRLSLEQGENDGLTVVLPPGKDSFEVPDGVLAPATPTHLEVAAIAANRNRTLVEVSFTTR
jgi:hypothetical protein